MFEESVRARTVARSRWIVAAVALGSLFAISGAPSAQQPEPSPDAPVVPSHPTADAPNPGASQDPTSKPTMSRDFEQLLATVDTAHRSESRGRVYDRFVGNLAIIPLADGQDPIEIQLSAKFLAPRALRYRVEEGGRLIERGSEPGGVLWGRNAEQTYRLVGREFREEQRTLESHIGLARQLLTFLDPAATLRELRDVSPVTDVELSIGRRKVADCKHVAGTLQDFPLFVGEGKPARVRLELWTQDGLLTAVRASVLTDDDRIERAEFVLLEDYRSLDGAEVPTRLTVFDDPPQAVSSNAARGGSAEAGAGAEAATTPSRRPLARIEITSLDLDPTLGEADFARPQ